jgi:hypothetical protein
MAAHQKVINGCEEFKRAICLTKNLFEKGVLPHVSFSPKSRP